MPGDMDKKVTLLLIELFLITFVLCGVLNFIR